MPTDEKKVIAKIVEVVEMLCTETASLVDDYATRVTRDAVAGVRGKASKIRTTAQELHTIAGTSGHIQDR